MNTPRKTESHIKEWKPVPDAPGNAMKTLRYDKETGASAILLKMDPGAHYAAHVHPGGEEVFVLSGSLQLGADFLRDGDFLYTPPGGIHAASSTEGCVVYISVPQAIAFSVPAVEEESAPA